MSTTTEWKKLAVNMLDFIAGCIYTARLKDGSCCFAMKPVLRISYSSHSNGRFTIIYYWSKSVWSCICCGFAQPCLWLFLNKNCIRPRESYFKVSLLVFSETTQWVMEIVCDICDVNGLSLRFNHKSFTSI